MVNLFDACVDKQLWRWINASEREVFRPNEKHRRWGMVCTCPQHVQDRARGAKHINCWHNSRRLVDAWPYVESEAAAMSDRSQHIGPDDCEGDAELAQVIADQIDFLATNMVRRQKYLKSAPWSFSRAGTRVGAKVFIDQVGACPLERHDAVTRRLWERHGDALNAFAAGGDPSPSLVNAVRIFNLSPLDESRGEGYHRSTTHEKKRAAASSHRHLKQSVRQKASLARIKAFRKMYGARAKDVLRCEWRRYKRLLQGPRGNKWTPVRMKASEFYARVYREDRKAEEDWKSVCGQVPLPYAHVTEQADTAQQLHNEYVLAQVETGAHYSVTAPTPTTQDDGQTVPEDGVAHFKLINIAHTHSRVHIMPTVESQDDLQLTAPLAFQIQRQTQAAQGEEQDQTLARQVFADGGPERVRPFRLTEFNNYAKSLTQWTVALPSTTRPGCLELSLPQRANPRFGVLDNRCPVLQIIICLKARGWSGIQAPVTHARLRTLPSLTPRRLSDKSGICKSLPSWTPACR